MGDPNIGNTAINTGVGRNKSTKCRFDCSAMGSLQPTTHATTPSTQPQQSGLRDFNIKSNTGDSDGGANGDDGVGGGGGGCGDSFTGVPVCADVPASADIGDNCRVSVFTEHRDTIPNIVTNKRVTLGLEKLLPYGCNITSELWNSYKNSSLREAVAQNESSANTITKMTVV